jgi:hypothetical protein
MPTNTHNPKYYNFLFLSFNLSIIHSFIHSSSFTILNKMTIRYVREAARLLKFEIGLLVLVTIRTKHLETQVLPVLEKQIGLVLVTEPIEFNNCGFTNCKLYVLKKKKMNNKQEKRGADDDGEKDNREELDARKSKVPRQII